jgi:hypothetical protein
MLHFQLKQKWVLQKQLNIYTIYSKRERIVKRFSLFLCLPGFNLLEMEHLMFEADLSMEPTFLAK